MKSNKSIKPSEKYLFLLKSNIPPSNEIKNLKKHPNHLDNPLLLNKCQNLFVLGANFI